jgi:hypothetical protein
MSYRAALLLLEQLPSEMKRHVVRCFTTNRHEALRATSPICMSTFATGSLEDQFLIGLLLLLLHSWPPSELEEDRIQQ